MLNYESEIEELIIKNLKQKYNILTTEELLLYLKTRYLIIYPEKQKYYKKSSGNIPIEEKLDYMKFLFKEELAISDYSYKENPIHSDYRENSLLSIFDNLEFQLSRIEFKNPTGKITPFYLHITETIENIYKTNLKLKNKNEKYLYANLKELNHQFGIETIEDVKKIYGFKQDNLDVYLQKETSLMRIVEASDFETTDISAIKEEDLRDYLCEHLDLVEEGLTYIEKEHIIPDGRLDIFAKDRNGDLVIIEVKIKDDERLPWQCMYYPHAVRQQYPKRIVRMMTIAPPYKESLLVALRVLPVQLFSCQILSSNHRIEKVTLTKVH